MFSGQILRSLFRLRGFAFLLLCIGCRYIGMVYIFLLLLVVVVVLIVDNGCRPALPVLEASLVTFATTGGLALGLALQTVCPDLHILTIEQ